jgi:hypothetical protein
VIIEFLLLLVPFVFLEIRHEATKALLNKAQDWLLTHAKQLSLAGTAAALPGAAVWASPGAVGGCGTGR